MKNFSINYLYDQIDKQIKLLEAYTEIENLGLIVKACRLKPYNYKVCSGFNKIILHKHWFDEFGNSLKINKNKKIEIIYNDLSLDRAKIISTDLYYGLSLDKIMKISQLAYISIGKETDLQQEYSLAIFKGIDNFLRAYLYTVGTWEQVSPLMAGFHNLQYIFKNLDVKHFHELKSKKNSALPCQSNKTWLTFMPASTDFAEIIKKDYSHILQI